MPPQISDDEGSASDVSAASAASVKQEVAKTPVQKGRSKAAAAAAKAEPEPKPESDDAEDDEEDDDDDDIGEDEYVVEKIISHLVDEPSGELRYEVKWEGYEKKADRTWEPEENLATAPKILEDYLAEHGGKDKIMADYHEKKTENKSKKRGRASTDAEANGTVAKRGRKGKNGVHPGCSTPPASATEFKPPSGNWEEQIVAIDACEGSDSAVVVYLTWKGGQKTQHPLSQVYKRCPQRMLKFYESHLVFKKNDEA